VLALGSDAPTAPHAPLRNVYTATTRRSTREPELEDRVNPHFALELAAAIAAGTEGSAYSCFADGWTGRLEAGRSADFAVVDMEWDAEKLLQARVVQTWFLGKNVFDADTAAT
jgi:predicted amidohydrolase YtcJ